MVLQLDSPTPDSTLGIGQRLGSSLRGGEIILLVGELGAGKTLFTKGIAQALGIDPREIVSPTFSLMNFFTVPESIQGKGQAVTSSDTFIHVDCYRLGEADGEHASKNGPMLRLPELDGWLGKAIIVVEWAQYLHRSYTHLPEAIRVEFEIVNGSHRRIHVQGATGLSGPGNGTI